MKTFDDFIIAYRARNAGLSFSFDVGNGETVNVDGNTNPSLEELLKKWDAASNRVML